jgi:hypothetical protein
MNYPWVFSPEYPMTAATFRTLLCFWCLAFWAPLGFADDKETLKKVQKAGGFVAKIGSEYGAAFDETKAGDNDLKLLLELNNITSLRLGENANMTDAAFRTVGRLKSLKQLHVFQSNFTDAALAELQGLQNLEELILDRTQMTGRGFASLSGLSKLSKLQFTGPNGTNAALKPISRLPNLYSLNLSGSKVTDDGLHDLAGMKKMGQLTLSNGHY